MKKKIIMAMLHKTELKKLGIDPGTVAEIDGNTIPE